MAFRKKVSNDFAQRMSTQQSVVAMNSTASKGLTRWANKDIQAAADTGDWTALLAKAATHTRVFRNAFYQ